MPEASIVLALLLSSFFLAGTSSGKDEFFYAEFSASAGRGANGSGSNICLNGVAEIEDGGILRLTNETSRLKGRAFFPVALRFRNANSGATFSFSTAFAFAFAIVPEYPKLDGHGVAFTIAPSKELPGAQPSQYLGLMNATNNGNSSNHGAQPQHCHSHQTPSSSAAAAEPDVEMRSSPLQKASTPELRPLPPLSRQILQSYANTDEGSSPVESLSAALARELAAGLASSLPASSLLTLRKPATL